VIDPGKAEVVWVLQLPSRKAQFHQFRASGEASWIEGGSCVDPCEPAGFALRRLAGVAVPWRIVSAPAGQPNTWQFAFRTALHPRAPCRA
jgi:hypothetical protein